MPASAVAMRTPAIAGMSGTLVWESGEMVVDIGGHPMTVVAGHSP
jgi:hypothetical protein